MTCRGARLKFLERAERALKKDDDNNETNESRLELIFLEKFVTYALRIIELDVWNIRRQDFSNMILRAIVNAYMSLD